MSLGFKSFCENERAHIPLECNRKTGCVWGQKVTLGVHLQIFLAQTSDALNGHSGKFPDRELFCPVSVELWLSDKNQQ